MPNYNYSQFPTAPNLNNNMASNYLNMPTGATWDETYEKLSDFAQSQAIMPDEVLYIDQYLSRRYDKVCDCRGKMTVGEFAEEFNQGIYLVTMSGHITCVIDGVIWDTFDPSDRFVWETYKVK